MTKKLLLPIIALCLLGEAVQAQNYTKTRASFGLKAGVNISNMRFKDVVGIDSKSRTGFVGGLFTNFPLGKVVSFQPEFLYSEMGGKIKPRTNISPEVNQKLNYFSIPLLLKFSLSQHFALLFGPQLDFLTGAEAKVNEVSTSNESNFDKNDFALTGGIQVWFGHHFGLDGRYIYGTKDVLKSNPNGKYYNQGFQFTANIRFGGKAIAAAPVALPVVIPQVVDTDGDGINDNDDKCPAVAGTAKYFGCPVPDTDGDGINDELDKCPSVAGTAKYNGCPIPDTDNDGINDEEDKCPTVAGTAKYNGCPIPDTDGDGVNDELDKCPNVAGLATNAGCPIIGIDAYKVTFKSGSAVLLPDGKKELDKAVAYLKVNEGFDIKIDGHTDKSGSDKINNPLSSKRADAVKAYFVKNGIPAERLFTEGFGSSQPVEDNKTAAGRKHNRRIEVKMKN